MEMVFKLVYTLKISWYEIVITEWKRDVSKLCTIIKPATYLEHHIFLYPYRWHIKTYKYAEPLKI